MVGFIATKYLYKTKIFCITFSWLAFKQRVPITPADALDVAIALAAFLSVFGGRLVFLEARLSPAPPTLLLLSIASVLLHPLR